MASVTIEVASIELLALKKLSLVSHALVEKFAGSFQAQQEQKCLAGVLDDVIRRIELAANRTNK